MFAELLWEYVKAHPWLTASSFLFMANVPINNVLLPHLYGKLVGAIEKKSDVVYYFVAVVVVFSLVQGLSLLYDFHDSYMNPSFQKFVHTNLTQKVMDMYDENYDESSTGDAISRFVSIPDIILSWFKRVKETIVPYVFTFAFAATYFYREDAMLGIGLIACVLLVACNLYFTARGCMKEAVDMSNAYNHVYEEFDEIMRNLMSIFSTDKQDDEIERLAGEESVFAKAYQRLILCGVWRKMLSFSLVIGFFMFFMYRCYGLVTAGKMKTATFVALFLMFTSMTGSLLWFAHMIQWTLWDAGMLVSTKDMLEANKPVAAARGGPVGDSRASPLPGVGLSDVTFMYKSATAPTLRGVNLNIKPGEKVVITGENGSGKSTILKILMRFLRPTSGDAYVGGKWYSEMAVHEVRSHFGYVPQNPVLFNRSAMENIRYGNVQSEEDVASLVEQLGLAPEFEAIGGLGGSVGKNGNNLSGGQRQLVMALRLLLRAPPVLIMDEPTTALDAGTKRLFFNMIDHMAKDATVIVVSHDPAVLQRFRNIRMG